MHELKIQPKYFEAVVSGIKTFEIRKDDRGFKVGDILVLKEYATDRHENEFGEEWSDNPHYTGREIRKVISYIYKGGTPGMGLRKGFSILAFKDYRIELNNRELKDIYGTIGSSILSEDQQIREMEKFKREEDKGLITNMKERCERGMILINKIAKEIVWDKE